MIKFNIPEEKKVRVIVDSDAKNEVDDQFAIVHAILTESFDLKGIVAAHFRKEGSMERSFDEVNLLLDKMKLQGQMKVLHGAEKAMPDEVTPVDSEGARFIIEEAMKDDDRPLYVACMGAITDVAAAILLEPEIVKKNIKIVWIGGAQWPMGGSEFNVKNDIPASNCVLKSDIELWMIPMNVTKRMPMSFSQMYSRIYDCGEIGRYLASNVVEFNNGLARRPLEYRGLGDSPTIGVIMYPDCGEWEYKPAPLMDEGMRYVHTGKYRAVRYYNSIDQRFIFEDMIAKLTFFSKENE